MLLIFPFFLFFGTSGGGRVGDSSSTGRRKKFGALHSGNLFLGSCKETPPLNMTENLLVITAGKGGFWKERG